MNTNPKVTYLTRRLSRAWKPIRKAVKARGFTTWLDFRLYEIKAGDDSLSKQIREEFKADFALIEEINHDLRKELNEQSNSNKV